MVADDQARNALALGLLSCLDDPDPAMRDGVAYGAIAHWLRHELLSEASRGAMLGQLLDQLQGPPDAAGFRQPFAALTLAEVARTDRIDAWLTPAQRAGLAAAAARYLAELGDYRGFDERDGWRHGVAHGSDLVLQLALNPAVPADSLKLMLGGLAGQVAPPGAVFYVYGEPDRLARAVFHAWRGGKIQPEWWAQWLAETAGPGPLAAWPEAYASQAGLARLHNTRSFLYALYLRALGSDDAHAEAFQAELAELLQALP